MSLIKRLFVFSLVVTTVLWSFGGLTVKAEGNYGAGSLLALQGASGAAVYYIGADGMKYVFPDVKTYNTWYSNFNDVVRVSVSELDMYEDGGAVTYRAGTKLITHENTAKVYAVGPGGVLHWIPSAAVAEDLYGANWTSRVMDVIPGYFSSSYTSGSDLSNMYPSGTLLQMGEDMYYVDGTDVRPFADADAFEANNFSYANLIEVASVSGYGTGESITGEETGLAGFMPAEGGNNGPVVIEGGLSVKLASDTPNGVAVVGGSSATLFSKFRFTASDGDVVVTGMKVGRTGLGSYDDFDKVWLVVDGVRRGSVKTLNSADQANLLFSADNNKVTIANGQTKVFELWASMNELTGNFTSGAYNGLGVLEVSTTSDVAGLPIYGNILANISASAPDVTVETATIGNTANAGNTNVIVSKFKVDNDESNETALFKGITLKSVTKSGTTRAYTDDFTNFRLYDNGNNLVAGPVEMGSDNYLRFTLSEPYEIAAGTNKYEWFYVKADALNGAGRTLNLNLEGPYDAKIYGGTNMYHSRVANSYSTTNQYVTLGASDLTVAVDTSVNPVAADVNQNTTVVLLAGKLSADKGAVNLDTFRIDLSGTDMDFNATSEFDNLRLYVDDVLVSETSSTYDDTSCTTASGAGETAAYACFTDSFSVTGVVPFRVEIDVQDLKTGDTGTIIKATVVGTTITGTTEADGTSIAGTGTATGNNMTVITPGYKIYKSATPVTATKVLGAQDVEFLGIDIKSNNTTNVVVNKIKFELNTYDAGGAAFTPGQNDVQNLELLDVNGNVIAGPQNLDASYEVEFSGLSLNVSSNGSKYILRGDIASSMTDTDFVSGDDGLWFAVISSEATANNNSYEGANSAGTTLADGVAEINTSSGTRINLGTGTLTVTAASDTPTSAQLVALSNGNAIAKWKLVAANENVQVKKFRVGLTTGSAGEDEVARIALYEGATKLAETYSFAGGYTEFDITGKNFVVSSGSGNARYLTMVVDLNSTSDSVLDSGATVAGVLIDLETWGATAEVAPYSGTTADGFAFVNAAGTHLIAGAMDISETVMTVDASHGVLAGDIVKVEDEQMYVSGVSTNDLTVVRGFNGSVAATHVDDSNLMVARSIEGNDFKAYGNKILVGNPSSIPSGTLAAWATYTSVFRFKLTPNVSATEEAVLNSVKVSLAQASGIGAALGTDWFIGDMALYNGAGTLISQLDTADGTLDTPGACGATGTDEQLCVGTDFVRFDALAVTGKNGAYAAGNRLSEPIAAGGEEYTVKVKTYGLVATNDALQFSISALGSVSTAGDLDWDDSVSANITWLDMGTVDNFVGGTFTK